MTMLAPFKVLFVLLTVAHLTGLMSAKVGFDPAPAQIPFVTKRAPRPIANTDLVSIRDVHGLSISPDGMTVALVIGEPVYQENSIRTGVFTVSTVPGSVPLSRGSAGLPHWDSINQWSPEPPQWSPDSSVFTYRMRTSQSELWQVWSWDREAGVPIQTSHVPGNVLSYEWTADGTRILLKVDVPVDKSSVDEYSLNGIRYLGDIHPWQCLPIVDEVLATAPKRSETWIHDVATGQERKATAEEASRYSVSANKWPAGTDATTEWSRGHHLENPKLSPNGKMVAYRYFIDDPAHAATFTGSLFSRPTAGGEAIELTPGAYYVSDFWWSWDSSKLYYTETEGDGHSDQLMLIPAGGGVAQPVISQPIPDYLASYSLDRSGQLLVCTRENYLLPPEVALIDVKTNQIRTLVNLNPEFTNLELSPAVRMQGRNAYGDTWFAHLVKPLDYQPGKKYPLIVTTYRSGDYFLRGASGNESPIQVYAAHGFAVLSFDIGRIRSHRSGDFHSRLLEWVSPIESINMAIHTLARTGIVDKRRIGIYGYSHGSEIAGYAVSHTRLFQVAVGAGGYDPYFYYMAGTAWHNTFDNWGLTGWPEGRSKPRWQVLSPMLNANRIDAPILINAADSEYLAELGLYASLEALRKPSDLYIYPDELHVKNQPAHRLEIYQRNLDWFRFWLKGEEDNDPAKGEQYRRWEELRGKSGIFKAPE
jgi:dipeptidyl aminopeptidase/acylaminoacyl peptidase